MDGPASSVTRALDATFSLLTRQAMAWLPVALGLGWLSALPGALVERWIPDYLPMLTARYGGLDPNALMGGLILTLVVVLVQLIVELVALVVLYIVLADLAAGREVSIVAGLKRTLAWRLQVSWLFSSILYTTATRLWFIGGCILFVPYGLAIPDAYEAGSGLGAFGRSHALGNLRIGGGRGPQPGWSLAGASTVILLVFAMASTAVYTLGALFLPGPDLDAVLGALLALDPTDPDAPVRLMTALVRTPSWIETGWTILQAPLSLLRETALLTVALVVYQDAVKHEGGAAQPA